MQTIQDKIINQIATMVATRTTNDSFPVFETALQLNYSNKGKIFILHAGTLVASSQSQPYDSTSRTISIFWRSTGAAVTSHQSYPAEIILISAKATTNIPYFGRSSKNC